MLKVHVNFYRIVGLTVLPLHPRFNLVSGVVIDDLRGIFLGITLALLHKWFNRNNSGEPYFIGSQVCIMSLYTY